MKLVWLLIPLIFIYCPRITKPKLWQIGLYGIGIFLIIVGGYECLKTSSKVYITLSNWFIFNSKFSNCFTIGNSGNFIVVAK